MKRNCAWLNALPPPFHDDDKPTPSSPGAKKTSTTARQINPTGLFVPNILNEQQSNSSATIQSVESSMEDSDTDDDNTHDQSDFLGLAKSNQVVITDSDVETVLRETYPKARPIAVEQPVLPSAPADFEDLDEDDEQTVYQQTAEDDDELLRYLPKSERYKAIKHVHIDSMLGDNARLQLLKNATEERETMKAQAAIHVPKGETKKRAQISYLVAKAQHDDLQLKNMWSQQKQTKRQTQAKYGF